MKAGWKEKSIGEILQLEYGKPLDERDRTPNGRFPVYGANGEKDRTDKFYYGKPSIIVGRKGSAGEINLTENKFWPLDVTYFVTFNDQQYDLQFLYYLLSTLELPKLAKGVKPGINRNEVYSQITKVPPLSEQKRIVGILDEAFDGIATAKANAEKNLQNARALFESHRHSVFQKKNGEWIKTTIDRISSNLDSRRIPITKSKRKSGKYPYYGASGIVDYVSEYIFDEDTLLVSEDGANLLARTTPIAFSVSGKYWVNNHAHILKFENMTTQKFVENYLESIKLDDYITGAAQPKLNQSALNSIPIPIPKSVTEQAKIVESIEKLAVETQRLESIYQKKLDALDELKKSLLNLAFSGEL
ncbi:MAG TPA: restriction endonuclease subunit S [Paludibacter sp.]|nr:restriction endonuclease subunit S [Paludibacter sp.]